MTKQQVFDKVYIHMMTQMERSENEVGMCMYRGPNGLKCAVGALIHDEYYSPDFEEYTPVADTNAFMHHAGLNKALTDSGVPPDCIDFCGDLQDLHDGDEPADWGGCLADMALRHGLTVPDLAPDWESIESQCDDCAAIWGSVSVGEMAELEGLMLLLSERHLDDSYASKFEYVRIRKVAANARYSGNIQLALEGESTADSIKQCAMVEDYDSVWAYAARFHKEES